MSEEKILSEAMDLAHEIQIKLVEKTLQGAPYPEFNECLLMAIQIKQIEAIRESFEGPKIYGKTLDEIKWMTDGEKRKFESFDPSLRADPESRAEFYNKMVKIDQLP